MIEGILKSKLKHYQSDKGSVLQFIKKDSKGFKSFEEVYFSSVNYQQIKGWKKHTEMTMNLAVPNGEVLFVFFDDRKDSSTKNQFYSILLSSSNYLRLTIEPSIWFAFKGISKELNLVVNLTNKIHDQKEIENIDLDKIDFNWEST